jgi:hypothetical protein
VGRSTRDLLVAWRNAAEELATEELGRPMLQLGGGSRIVVAYERTLIGIDALT